MKKNTSNAADSTGIEKPAVLTNVITPDDKSETVQVQQLEQIGKGAFGVIYKGLLKDQAIAIKETGNRNLNEIKIMCLLAKLHAPYVVHLIAYSYSLEDRSNRLYLQYMKNNSIKKYIKANPQPEDWSLRYLWIQEIARGLAYLHQLKIVHKDIKADNILLDDDLHAKISDFGFAEIMENDRLTSATGSLLWVAPEVFQRMSHNEKADIFSLAVTIWEIANWKEPQPYKPEEEFLVTDLAIQVLEKRQSTDEIGKPKLAKLITWGWQGNPENRPSAKEVVEELESGIDTLSENLLSRQ
ncbi:MULTISPECIES: protein kinase [unclassified Legionella]|uniref:protein kinase domain-containing protein n=1 Tax=unclassified Legionella TaxID=2622702 RepID=UPI001056E049|nr:MULTISPECIES: protein kinase [unclassified Legionella]MDI9817928.1 protein kinase [Legionella sp. PL877]